jgi:hypothetical protein
MPVSRRTRSSRIHSSRILRPLTQIILFELLDLIHFVQYFHLLIEAVETENPNIAALACLCQSACLLTSTILASTSVQSSAPIHADIPRQPKKGFGYFNGRFP